MRRKSAPPLVSQRDIKTLIKKLEKWGQTLPQEERQLLEYVLERAEGVALTDAPSPKGSTTIGTLTETVMSAGLKARRPHAWVRGGPAWIRQK